MSGSAFDVPALPANGDLIEVPTDGNALAPARDRAAAVRALALARAVLGADQAATVDADTQAKIAAVIRAAGA